MTTALKNSDWRENKTLSQCMLYMLENEIMCDVTLIVGETKTKMKAHKYMLSTRSEVFHTMFEGSLPEKGDILIPDIDKDTFRNLLRFVYTDKMLITEKNASDMWYASNKYMMWKVKKECERVLKEIATSEHAITALDTAVKYKLPDLQKASLVYIENNAKACFTSMLSTNVSHEGIEMILKSEFIDCAEDDVCEFFLKWITARCTEKGYEINGNNLRNVAGNLLKLVRFPVVKMKYFSNEIVKTNILTPEEMLNIYQSHFTADVSDKLFNRNPRRPVKKRTVYNVKRIEQAVPETYQPNVVQALEFQSDTVIWLKKVTIFIPVRYQGYNSFMEKSAAEFSLYSKNDILVISRSVPFFIDTRQITLDIELPTPVQIMAGDNYTITTTMSVDHHQGDKIMTGRECTALVKEPTTGVKITFKTSPKDTSGTNIDNGQFSCFSFSV